MARNTQNAGKPAPTTTGAGALAVAEKQPTQALALSEDMSWATQHHSDYGMDDISIPFIRVLQKLSPQVDRDAAEFIEGAQPGMLFNTATGEIFDGVEQGIVFVPVKFTHDVTEWHPRSAGGGLVARHGADVSQLDRLGVPDNEGKRYTKEGTQIVDSALYFGIIVRDDGSFEQAVVLMSSTGWKAARQWNTRQRMLVVRDHNGKQIANPAPFLAAWRIRTVLDENEKGKFYRWNTPEFEAFTTALPTAPDILASVRVLLDGLKSGRVKAADPADGVGPAPAEDMPF